MEMIRCVFVGLGGGGGAGALGGAELTIYDLRHCLSATMNFGAEGGE